MREESETMEYVLFSAVGDTDPVRDGFDGPLLHIVRHYRPKRVYLFFTSEMARRDRATDCYSKSINHLIQGCLIEKTYTEIENASDFDAFHVMFTDTISRIRTENPDSEILLNISSGTPQIKMAMSLEVVSHHSVLRPVQVSAPGDKTNKDVPHFDLYKDDLEYELENLYDNLDDAKNRCSSPDLIGIRKSMIKNKVRSLVASWNYKGAYDLIMENRKLFSRSLLLLLKHAYLRCMPEEKGAEKAAKLLDNMYYELYPVRSSGAKLVCEYYLAAKQRKNRGEMTDFLLRMTTLAEHMMEIEIEHTLGGMNKIAYKQSSGWKIDHDAIKRNNPGLKAYLDRYGIDYKRPIGIRTYEYMAVHLGISGYEKIFDLRNKRNDSAHGLKSVTEEDFRDIKTSSAELCRMMEARIKKVFGKEIKQSVFSVFEKLNTLVSEDLDRNAPDTPET